MRKTYKITLNCSLIYVKDVGYLFAPIRWIPGKVVIAGA